MGIRCFYVEPTNKIQIHLRRYKYGEAKVPEHLYQSGHYGYHNVRWLLETKDIDPNKESDLYPSLLPQDDLRWNNVAKCEDCGYLFQLEDEWQMFILNVYIDKSTGKEYTLHDKIPGMMWDATWWSDTDKVGGQYLVVICPDSFEWRIDGRANNCDMRDDYPNHHCWIRQGIPPNITVGKNGKTCHAGAGSILSRNGYHGFLTNGEFNP